MLFSKNIILGDLLLKLQFSLLFGLGKLFFSPAMLLTFFLCAGDESTLAAVAIMKLLTPPSTSIREARFVVFGSNGRLLSTKSWSGSGMRSTSPWEGLWI